MTEDIPQSAYEDHVAPAEDTPPTVKPARSNGVRLSASECEIFQAAVADALCWFQGFRAAHCGSLSEPEMPMSIDSLRDLNLRLQRGRVG